MPPDSAERMLLIIVDAVSSSMVLAVFLPLPFLSAVLSPHASMGLRYVMRRSSGTYVNFQYRGILPVDAGPVPKPYGLGFGVE